MISGDELYIWILKYAYFFFFFFFPTRDYFPGSFLQQKETERMIAVCTDTTQKVDSSYLYSYTNPLDDARSKS